MNTNAALRKFRPRPTVVVTAFRRPHDNCAHRLRRSLPQRARPSAAVLQRRGRGSMLLRQRGFQLHVRHQVRRSRLYYRTLEGARQDLRSRTPSLAHDGMLHGKRTVGSALRALRGGLRSQAEGRRRRKCRVARPDGSPQTCGAAATNCKCMIGSDVHRPGQALRAGARTWRISDAVRVSCSSSASASRCKSASFAFCAVKHRRISKRVEHSHIASLSNLHAELSCCPLHCCGKSRDRAAANALFSMRSTAAPGVWWESHHECMVQGSLHAPTAW